MSNIKPMRGVKADLTKLDGFPYLVSPKIDGIRAIVKDGVVYSKTMKPIPNQKVQAMFGHLHGLDGELVVGEAKSMYPGDDVYGRSRGPIMTKTGDDRFVFCVFDRWDMVDRAAQDRIDAIDLMFSSSKASLKREGINIVGHYEAQDVGDIEELTEAFLEAGFEGVMLRDANGVYKYGTSTQREGYLLKVKPMQDSEAFILGVVEQQENTNVATVNDIGLSVRSTNKAGKVGKDTLGAFRVKDCYSGIEFDVGNGPGLTAKLRSQLWAARDTLPGQIIRYTFQAIGTIDKPRLPQFTGFRDPIDMADL